jgi:uncharacterized glyoxalase superfamily protein PhnB
MASKKASKKKTSTRAKAARSTKPRKSPPSGALALRSVAPSFTVGDLDKSIAWYGVLGFKVTDRWERDGKLMGVEMQAGGVTVMLGQDDWQKGRDRVKGAGLRIYCETGQDIDGLADRIKARGGTLAQEPRDEPWGARQLSVEDPDGFKITIFKTTRRGR